MTPKELCKRAGGYARIAAAIGIKSHTAPMRWRQIPAEHIVVLERELGIPREQLRPDLYAPRQTEHA